MVGVLGQAARGEGAPHDLAALVRRDAAQRVRDVLRHGRHDDLRVRVGEHEPHAPSHRRALAARVEAVDEHASAVGTTSPLSRRARVLLPEPFAPTTPTRCSRSSRLTPRRTSRSPSRTCTSSSRTTHPRRCPRRGLRCGRRDLGRAVPASPRTARARARDHRATSTSTATPWPPPTAAVASPSVPARAPRARAGRTAGPRPPRRSRPTGGPARARRRRGTPGRRPRVAQRVEAERVGDREHLGRERLDDLDRRDVVEPRAGAVEHGAHRGHRAPPGQRRVAAHGGGRDDPQAREPQVAAHRLGDHRDDRGAVARRARRRRRDGSPALNAGRGARRRPGRGGARARRVQGTARRADAHGLRGEPPGVVRRARRARGCAARTPPGARGSRRGGGRARRPPRPSPGRPTARARTPRARTGRRPTACGGPARASASRSRCRPRGRAPPRPRGPAAPRRARPRGPTRTAGRR